MIVAVQYRVSGGTASEIAASVEKGVRDGALKPDDSLPSVRSLAQTLGVSPATVSAAYAQLRRRGMIATAGRNGTRVRSAPPVTTPRSVRALPMPFGLRDLASGEPSPRLLPDLADALAQVAAEPAEPIGYRNGGVLPELFEAARRRLAELPPDSALTVVSGALDGIERLLASRLRPGDRVGVEDPGWAALIDLLAALELQPVPMPLDDQGPTVAGVEAALSRGARAVIITCRAQNPTGAAVTGERAALLRPLLRDVLVIEDDHAGELAPVPLHLIAAAEQGPVHWALLRSASKPYGPDLRCAILAGDAETVSRVAGRMRLGPGWVSTVLQRMVLRLWRDFDPAPSGRAYDLRRAALLGALSERGMAAAGRTGINVWIPVPDETMAVASLRDAGYAVSPGHLYRIASPPGIRVTIADLELDEVEQVADAIAAAVRPGPLAVTR